MPLQSTSGAASYDAFGGGTVAKVNYIEDFFQSYLRTGTGASATVTTGLDGSTKETLVWTKSRSAATNHKLTDNVRGATKALSSNTTGAEATDSQGLTAFSATGYTVGTNTDYNNSGATYVDWQWVSQPKFFDVVTYTGNDSASRQIAHNLGSTPGCIFVKCTSNAQNWFVNHRSLATANAYLNLNTTDASATGSNWGNAGGTYPTSTNFTVGDNTNIAGRTYVAYLFAHNAGGFGLTGTDNVISCGSVVTNGLGAADVNLGYEPQWVLWKRADGTGNWHIIDTMRGMSQTSASFLYPNTSAAESTASGAPYFTATATGFHTQDYWINDSLHIYIAIRRGPMKVPTLGTSVFSPFTTAGATGTAVTTNFPVDFQLYKYRAGIDYWFDVDRLRGVNSTTTANSTPWLDTTATTAEASATNVSRNWGNTGFEVPGIVGGASNVFYSFRRAPGFFDEVCYTGTGSARTVTHNLGVAPELIIVKKRSATGGWPVYTTGNQSGYMALNTADAFSASTSIWNNTAPTSTVFTVGTAPGTNESGSTFVSYLFATCAGVSKVGSYTGTGSTQTIACGFTGGARFVLIKRTDADGNPWFVWDTARGMVSGTDPRLALNNTDAETNANWVYTTTGGFQIVTTDASVNASGGSYIYLSVA